jgi:uncharacterized protein (DUF1330 family)
MPKAYWVATYRAITDEGKFQAYARLSGPAIESNGGRFVVRGNPGRTFEHGLMQRVVIIEFDSIDHAVKTHDSEAYQAALKALDNAADRDIRIVEGVS